MSTKVRTNKKIIAERIIIAIVITMVMSLIIGQCAYQTNNAQAEDAAIRQNQLEECERGNLLIIEVNNNREILRDVLIVAADSRELSAAHTTDVDENLNLVQIAARFREFADELDPVPLTNCVEEYAE